MSDTKPLWQIATIELPASKAGLTLMSQAGWWVHKDGRITRKRKREHEQR